ncbi:Gfo/Idh/MocA family oxidoreductase [Candidatus Poribacteria bacterium]|nr:Gfo/Idh/MocA family oxidoreductase [Candidatus Poribacteria bacterium]
MSKYRAGVIGCGQIGKHHARAYKGVEEIELVAATDSVERVRKAMQEDYGVAHVYGDFREMLEKEKLDLVSVCTWHLLHTEHTIAAAEYSPKGIICEKPMTVSLKSADEIIDACDKRGIKLAIGHQRRFYRSWTKAKELIQEGVIGQPLMVTAKSGEGLLNCGTHVVDAIRYLLNDPETDWVMAAVERKTDRYEREVRIEDCCMGLITFKNGVQALIQSDLTAEWSVENYSVRGTDGVMEVTTNRLRFLSGKTTGWQEIDTGYDDPWVCQAKEMISWIEGKSEHRGDARQARQTVEILMAIYQSARDHEVVRAPLQVKEYPMDLMFEEGKIPVVEPGKYDIRAFLAMEPEERKIYDEMRRKGVHPRDIFAEMCKT